MRVFTPDSYNHFSPKRRMDWEGGRGEREGGERRRIEEGEKEREAVRDRQTE